MEESLWDVQIAKPGGNQWALRGSAGIRSVYLAKSNKGTMESCFI